MELKSDFSFKPLPPIPHPNPIFPPVAPPIASPIVPVASPLGPLHGLLGAWTGTGFNVIWRPNSVPGQDRFLELNLTNETIEFVEIPGEIPNRGLLQGDINMFGVRYLQQIQDHNNKAGLHIEPGIWAFVPKTTNPAEAETVVRMASIPHGTTILAQGLAHLSNAAPAIAPVKITPFLIGNAAKLFQFPESTLAIPTQFRSPPADLAGVTQAMIDNPNSILSAALSGQTVLETTALVVSSSPSAPVLGGGTSNTAFLQGGTSGPNANAVQVDAIFWIMKIKGPPGKPDTMLLQYTQTVLLNFNGLSWPHISVATLHPSPPAPPSAAAPPPAPRSPNV